MMNLTPLNQRFAQLQTRFIERIRSEQAEITTLLVALDDSHMREASLRKLLPILHRYKGNGESFGFPEVTLKAQIMEQALERMLAAPAIPPTLVRNDYEALRAVINALPASPDPGT